jgi:uncharacterized protein YndB with AHSA1/START domain
MERKTKITADEGKHDLLVTREFELPVGLLFKAFVEPDIVAQWMGTNVLKLEAVRHGCYQFETTDPQGNKHGFNGVFHDVVPNRKITRTFEMEQSSFGVQLEFLEFEERTPDTSSLTIQMVFRSAEHRDQMLRLPFSFGINMAHDRLQEIVRKLFLS